MARRLLPDHRVTHPDRLSWRTSVAWGKMKWDVDLRPTSHAGMNHCAFGCPGRWRSVVGNARTALHPRYRQACMHGGCAAVSCRNQMRPDAAAPPPQAGSASRWHASRDTRRKDVRPGGNCCASKMVRWERSREHGDPCRACNEWQLVTYQSRVRPVHRRSGQSLLSIEPADRAFRSGKPRPGD